jgi:hypothetical protein
MASEDETDNRPTSLPPDGTNTEIEEPRHKRRSLVVSWIALGVAFVGGIPGILALMEFFNKTSAKIIFDSENSRLIPISSDNPELAGKTALILLRIRIVGTGEKDAHISDVATAVRYNGRWVPGTRLHPKLAEERDSKGVLKKYITVKHKRDADTSVVTHMAWQEFEPGRYALGYGESRAFSYACHYEIPGEDRYAISRLRLRVYDYLGNSYQTEVGTDSMMLRKLDEVVLLAD